MILNGEGASLQARMGHPRWLIFRDRGLTHTAEALVNIHDPCWVGSPATRAMAETFFRALAERRRGRWLLVFEAGSNRAGARFDLGQSSNWTQQPAAACMSAALPFCWLKLVPPARHAAAGWLGFSECDGAWGEQTRRPARPRSPALTLQDGPSTRPVRC